MIQELPRYDDLKVYNNEPLLEYVVKFSNQFLKHYNKKSHNWVESLAPEQFCHRLFCGKIEKVDCAKTKFEDAIETKETICAYGLDIDKFWYLCLFLKDYSKGQTIAAAKSNPTHREELNRLITELDKLVPSQQCFIDKIKRYEPASPINRPKPQENIIKTQKNGTLTVKIGEDKVFIIADGQTLTILKEILRTGLRHLPKGNNCYLDTAPPVPYNASQFGIQYQVALFYNLMKQFLSQYMPDRKEYKGSTDKRLLISRLIYLLNIDDDSRYYITEENVCVEGKIAHLKNTIKRYKNIDIPVQNAYYPNTI